MKVVQICLLALFATAIFAAPIEVTTQTDITIPSTHGFLIVEEDNIYLYTEEDNPNLYFYFESFVENDEWLIAFGDPTGGVKGGLSITLEEDTDLLCSKVIVEDLKFTDDKNWAEDGTVEGITVALNAVAPQVCIVQITLVIGNDATEGDEVTTAGAEVTGTWYASVNLNPGGTDEIDNGDQLVFQDVESFYSNIGAVQDGAQDLLGNQRFNLWNGIWWGEGDEDNLISIVTNHDDSYWQIGVDGDNDAQIYRVLRVGAHFTVTKHDGEDDTNGLRDQVTFVSSTVSADYEDYAFVQFTLETTVGDFVADQEYTIGYGTAINSLTTEDVTLFEGDFTTAGSTDTDIGTLVSGAAADTAEEEDGEEFYNIDVRYEVDGDDITFDVDFKYDSLTADFIGSVLFDMGEDNADILTFWWLSSFQVPAMESFNGDATTANTVDDDDLKDDWSWSGYNVVIGESARFAVTRAVIAPADGDVSFAGDDFTFSWVYHEGGDRNDFNTNTPFAAVTVEFPDEEEEEEESEGGESEESEEESDSASMIVSSIVSLLSLLVLFA